MKSYVGYANNNAKPAYTCPHCESSKKTQLTPIMVRERGTIDFKCACGSRFVISREYKRNRRVLTDLEGSYTVFSDGNKKRIVRVKNLSIGGIGFTTRTLFGLSVGDTIELTFTLDDEKRSEVRKGGIVRHIFNHYVGCEFTETSNRDVNFEFYLMS